MDTHGNKNFNKLAFILLDPVSKQLRYIFRQEWDTQHSSNPWQNDNHSLLYLKTKAKQHGTWKSSTAPKAGDPDDWDPTNLFYVLLNSKTISLSAAHNQHIHKLREIRNKYFAHPSTASINDTDFEAIYQDIEKCMIGLNCSSCVQKQMEDVKNGILKVPEDYLKEVSEKLDIIKTVETDNNKLLMQSHLLLRKYEKKFFILPVVVSVIVSMIFIYLFIPYLHPGYDHIELSTRTTCNSSRIFFPESRKPSYYRGHDWEINTGANVLANGSNLLVSITGPPAIGKTATAIAVGQVLKNSHGYQVAFVDFKEINVSNNHIRTDIYKHIVLAIDYELENVSDSVQKFIMLMKKITTCPTLLLFDNIENILNSTSKAIFYEVTKICLEINKIKVLTTSRKEFDIIGVSIHPIQLEPLPKSQSTGLLVSLLPDLQQKSIIKKIAEKTGGIPLLLEVAASLVRSKYYKQSQLLNRFEELPILVVLNDTNDMTESSNYYKLLKIVYDGLDPSVQFTWIAFGAVPIYLDQTKTDSVVNFNFSEKVDLYSLVNYNLLKTFDMPSGQTLYGMHPVISEFTRLVAEDSARWSKLQHIKPGSCMVETSPTCESLSYIMADYGDMTLEQPVWENVGKIPTILVHNELTERDKRRFGNETIRTGLEFYNQGQYTECIDFLILASKKNNNNQLRKILALCALKATKNYLKQGELNLSTGFSNLLLKTLNLIETDPCFVAISLLNLGMISDNMRFYKDAAFVLKRAVTNYQQQFQQQNCSKEDLGSWAFKLGETFYYHRQYHESINVLLISTNLLKSHDDKLNADSILADSYDKTQNYETCFQIVRRVLNSSYEVNYHKQRHVFHNLTNLALKAADTYLNQRNVSMAIQFNILSLNTLNMLETDSCFVASLYFRVGFVLYNIGTLYRHAAFAFNQTWAFDAAFAFNKTWALHAAFAFNQTWEFHKQNKCGEDDLGLVAYYLGGAYYHCGQYYDSIDILKIALRLLEKYNTHQFMANSLLAFSYYEIQDHETSYQITRNILSNNFYLNTVNSSYLHEMVLINLTNIVTLAASEYHIQGNYNQSIEFYHLSIATLKRFAPHSCSIALWYSTLGMVLHYVQRHADAAAALNEALEFYKRNGCDEHVALQIGNSFLATGQYNNSINVLLGTMNQLKKNPNHRFQANFVLVLSYFKLQDYVNSFRLLRQALDCSFMHQVDQLRYKHEIEFLRKLAIQYSQPSNANLNTDYGNLHNFFSKSFKGFLKFIGY